jgi:spermidine/putrescine-binding protein
MTRFPPTRRRFLQSLGAGFADAAGAPLIGCTTRSPGQVGGSARQLKVFNWSDYIDETVVADFERLTGCTVVYDNYSSDAELETRLATGGGSYDVVFPSDRTLPALLAKGRLRPIDRSRLSNLRHIDPQFLGLPFDRENRFSVPYFWGTLAVGIRTDCITGPVEDLAVLFDERYRGRITMLDDMENVVAATLGYLGLPHNSVEPGHLEQAQALLVKQKPLVQAYTSDSYRERLITGEVWAALGWSGDFLQADAELIASRSRGRVKVVVPAGGTMLWMDSMAIPRSAASPELAHQFLNYLLEPAVAVQNALKVNFATPNASARQMLPASMLADGSIYPAREVLTQCAWLQDRGKLIERIERVWRAVRQ